MLNEMNEIKMYTIDNQFLPNINWFKISIKGKYINFSSFERWKKMSFGNRCTLSGGNGLVNLSIPLEKGRDQKSLFRDIKISYLDNLQVKFWITIISSYNRSPFFEYYGDGFREILFKKHSFLQDLNIEMIYLCLNYLSINKEVMMVSDDNLPHIDSRKHYLTPKTYHEDPDPVIYHQMFIDRFGFQANLSILDLLFMEGPEAHYLLNK